MVNHPNRSKTVRDHAYYLHLARCNVAGCTPEQYEAIATYCVAAAAKGENAGIWHAAAQVFGYPERCHCYPCSKARGEEGKSPFRYHHVA